MLIAVAVLGVMSMAFASMVTGIQKDLRTANRKIDAMETRSVISKYLSNLPLCGCLMDAYSLPFSESLPAPSTSISMITSTCPTGTILAAENQVVPGTSTNLEIASMKITDIKSLGIPDRFRGKVKVDFKSEAQSLQLKGFELEIQFRTDPATPPTAKKVSQCDFVASATSSGGGDAIEALCPPGQFMIGFESGVAKCSAVAVAGKFSNNNSALPFSITSPGPGCSGHGCMTADYGPCYGHGCLTNGNYCEGDGCKSCGPSPSCSGAGCTSGDASCAGWFSSI